MLDVATRLGKLAADGLDSIAAKWNRPMVSQPTPMHAPEDIARMDQQAKLMLYGMQAGRGIQAPPAYSGPPAKPAFIPGRPNMFKLPAAQPQRAGAIQLGKQAADPALARHHSRMNGQDAITNANKFRPQPASFSEPNFQMMHWANQQRMDANLNSRVLANQMKVKGPEQKYLDMPGGGTFAPGAVKTPGSAGVIPLNYTAPKGMVY